MWRLIAPLRYLRIRHPEKIKFDLIFPLVFALFFCLPLASSKFRSDALANLDLLGRSSDILSILTGFFVAALAAVATFGNPEMDEPMAGTEPVKLDNVPLSRRRFLSYLFGYLALLSIAIYLFGFAFYGFHKYFLSIYIPDASAICLLSFWVIYGVLIGNLLSNALLGLFYLTDRIHRPNRVISYNKSTTTKHENSEAA